MLFLLNDVVYDILDPSETLATYMGQIPFAHNRHTRQSAIETGCAMALSSPGFKSVPLDGRMALCCILAATNLGVNAAVFVAPPGARIWRDVQSRLASVPLELLGRMHQLQQVAPLDPGTVNRTVWLRIA